MVAFESAFHRRRSEHGMPAHNVGAGGIECAAIEMHFNGDYSKNAGLQGEAWKLWDANIDPLYRLVVSRDWNLILTLRKAGHREERYDKDQRSEPAVSHEM